MSMQSGLSKLTTFTHRLARTAIVISAAGLVLMTLIIGWQVFARYVLNASPAWSESSALLLMLYYIMLAAAVGVYENFHLGLKILIDSVPANRGRDCARARSVVRARAWSVVRARVAASSSTGERASVHGAPPCGHALVVRARASALWARISTYLVAATAARGGTSIHNGGCYR